MSIKTLTSREFHQATGRAKHIAEEGPVFITKRGKPTHVLLTVEEYKIITKNRSSIVNLLAMPDATDVEFDPARLKKPLYKPTDLF